VMFFVSLFAVASDRLADSVAFLDDADFFICSAMGEP